MTTDAIYKEHGSDWSHQVSVVATTRWLQRDQTLPLSAKGVACKTNEEHCYSSTCSFNLRVGQYRLIHIVSYCHAVGIVSKLSLAGIAPFPLVEPK